MTIHVYPRRKRHRLEQDGGCWCQPRVEERPPWYGRLVIHKALSA